MTEEEIFKMPWWSTLGKQHKITTELYLGLIQACEGQCTSRPSPANNN